MPVVGDWVVVRGGAIDAVLPRRTMLTRKAPGVDAPQALAANVDVLFIVVGLDHDFNPRRIERYLVLARASGAEPVVVLNKIDLAAGPLPRVDGAPVIAVSALNRDGVGEIEAAIPRSATGALIGSSGAGKSTIINALLGRYAIATQPVREDDSRGRHTTTHREIVPLPSGALLMDMPGLREVGLWADESAVEAAFADIAELAAGCRFRDCRHQGEPGCAVATAVDAARLASFHKLEREVAWLERRDDKRAQAAQRQQWKAIHKAMRRVPKLKT